MFKRPRESTANHAHLICCSMLEWGECWPTVHGTLNPPVLTRKVNIPTFYVFLSLCLFVCLFVCFLVFLINEGRRLHRHHMYVL